MDTDDTMTSKRHAVTLSDDDLLAKGGGRRIYAHPSRPDVVIKLHKHPRVKRLQGLRNLFRTKRRRFGMLLNSIVEIDEFAAMVGRTADVPDFASQFLGFVPTNLGPGAMFEAIKTPDGRLAPTLRDHGQSNGPDPAMDVAIDRLWDEVIRFRAVISDPALRNVVVTGDADQGYHLTFVDGLGERTAIPIQSWSDRAYQAQCSAARAAMKRDYNALAKQA